MAEWIIHMRWAKSAGVIDAIDIARSDSIDWHLFAFLILLFVQDGRPENRTNFLILHGSDVAPGEIFPSPVIADVAPTVLAHLGVKISSAWHLDGRPVGLKLTRRGHFMDLTKSQDPLNMFPIPKEELDAEGYAQHPTTGIAETN